MNYKSFIKPLLALALSMFLALSLSSCESIYDTYSDCHIYVKFKYDYNMGWTDRFAEQCDAVELFLFDSTGVLKEIISDGGERLKHPDYLMEIPVHSGRYSIMAWTGRQHSYELTDMIIGVSTMSDMILKLKPSSNNVDVELDPLWWGAPIDFAYSGDSHQVEIIDLLKNTNVINVNIHYDLAHTPDSLSDINVSVNASNGAYLFDNSFTDPKPIKYVPYYKTRITKADETFSYALSTLRIVKGQNVKLSIIDEPKNANLLPFTDMNLIPLLLMTKPDGIGDQEYLDREDTWNLDLYLTENGYAATSIMINGWTVWTQDTEL